MAIGSTTGNVLGTVVFAPGAPGGAGGPGGGPPPTPGTGWELKVVSAADYSTLLCYVPDRLWTSLTTSDMLNSQSGGSQGSGTVVLNLDDPWWATATLTDAKGTHPAHYLLDAEHLWQLWQNGVCRFEWLGESVTETLVQQGEGRLVTVTGPDTSQVLNWAAAMPNGFPNDIVYKTDALQDAFSEVDVNGNLVLDTGLWNASSSSGVTINPSGSARIAGGSSAVVLGSTTWDLSSSLLSAQVTPIVSPDANGATLNGSQLTQMYLEDVSTGNYVLIGMSGTSLYAQYNGPDGKVTKVIDSAAGYAAVQQGAGTYAYWQISHAAGFFYFWTSSDGQNWTQQYSHAAGWTPSSVGVFFAATYTGSTAEWATVTSVNSNVTTSSLGGPVYSGEPIMGVFLQTLQAAQARGTVPWVTSRATAAYDSYGNPWTDTNNVQIQNGTSLYQLLQGQAAMINADWKFFPGFELRIGIPNAASPSPNNGNVTLGFDRSNFVRFYEAGGETAKTRQRTRNQIVNLLAAINNDGRTVTAQNATSVASWSQREAWIQAAAQVTEADLVVVADAAVLANDSEVLAWTLQIPPNLPGRTVYQDFQVGDWVGLERPDYSGTDAVRVVGITVTIDQDGNEVHELILVSYMQWLTQNLLYIQQKMGGAFVSAAGTTAVSGNAAGSTQQTPTVFDVRLGALGTSGASGAPMVYNAATGQWVPAGSTDSVSGQVVNLSVPGAGQGTIIGGGTITVGTTGNNPGPLNSNYNFPNGSAAGWSGQRETLAVVAGTTVPGGFAPDAYVGKLTPTQNGSATWLTTQAGTPQVPTVSGIVAGNSYTLTAQVFLPSQATMTIAVKVDWYSAVGALLSSTAGTAGPVAASAWQQISDTVTAPNGAAQCNIFIGPTTAVTTNSWYVTDFYIYNASDASGAPDASGAGGSTTTTIDSTGTTVTDGTGTVRAITGLQADGTITFQGYNSPAPAAPDTPTVTPVMLGINVAWDGLLGGAAPLLDFEQVQLHMSTTSGFTPGSATLQTTFTAAGNYTVTQLTAGTTYYFVLVAENDAGTLSAASAQVSASPQTVSQNIPNGSISSGQLNFSASGVNVTFAASAPVSPAPKANDLWYDASNGNELNQFNGTSWTPYQFGTNAITAGSVTTGLLAANAVTAGKIAAGTITAVNLAVGSTTQQNIYAAGGDTTGWTGHGGTLTGLASGLPAGAPYSSCFKLSTDGSTSGPAVYGSTSTNGVIASGSYMCSAWVYSANTAAQLGFVWLNGSGGVISSSLTGATITASTWTQLTAFGTAPAGAVSCYLVAGLQGTPANGTLLYATEIKLFSPFNGGIIQAGTIATAQLAAGAVTTGTLAAGAVTAAKIAANTITSTQIQSGTISANDLAVGGTYNQNSYFAAADVTGYTASSGSVSGTGSPPGTPPFANAAVLTCNGGASPYIAGPQFAVQASSFYMAQCWVYSANTSAVIGFQWFDANKNPISTATQGWTLTANTWTQIDAVKQAPGNAAYAQLQVGLSGTPSNGTQLYAQEALVFVPFNGGIIEAGTITATQIGAGQVTTGTLAAGAVTAAKIAAGTVVAGIVNATTISSATLSSATINASTINGTDYIIDSTGAFFYSGTPALNNLVASITPYQGAGTTGTCPAGNTYLTGVYNYASQGGNYGAAGLAGGSLLYWSQGSNQQSAFTQLDGLTLNGTTGLALHDYRSGATVEVTQNTDDIGAAVIQTTGFIYPSHPGSSSFESWQDITANLQNSWHKSSTGHCQIKLTAIGTALLLCSGLLPGTISDGTQVLVLPSGYEGVGLGSISFPVVVGYTTAPGYGSTPEVYVNGNGLFVSNLRGTVGSLAFCIHYPVS